MDELMYDLLKETTEHMKRVREYMDVDNPTMEAYHRGFVDGLIEARLRLRVSIGERSEV